MSFARSRIALAVLALVLIGAPPADAQTSTATGVPNALQGFSQNRDKPVQIDANSLEVRDKDKVATFAGNVRVLQGDTEMRCGSLVVFYDADTGGQGAKTSDLGTGGNQSIRRLEAKGGVKVTQKEQVATGDTGIFDMKTNTITLLGNVAIMQGQNIIRGERLVVDMTSGVSRVESKGGGGVRALIQPSSRGESPLNNGGKPAPQRPPTRQN